MNVPLALERYERAGFDQTEYDGEGMFRPACSCCQVVCVNGTACHETGCENAKHECKGCNELIPVRQKYCADCA